jgi:hypothetical protein
MQNDSIETLLLRHLGSTGAAPEDLETRLLATVRQEAREMERQKHIAAAWHEKRISRRRVLRLVAFGSAGLGVVGIGLDSLRRVEASLLGQNAGKPAYS